MKRHLHFLPLSAAVFGLAAIALGAGCGQPAPSDAPEAIHASERVTEALPETVRAALEEGDDLHLVSLDPYPREVDPEGWEQRGFDRHETLRGYAVLGRMPLGGAGRSRAVQALYDGIHDSDGTVAACFDPRHAFVATHAGHAVEVIVCFECLFMRVLVDGERVASPTTTEAPQRVLDGLLRQAEVPLPDR